MLKFVHLVDQKICVAYEPASEERSNKKSAIFKMTTVLCHKNDQYKKADARLFARMNIENGQFVLVRIPEKTPPNVHFFNVAENLSY